MKKSFRTKLILYPIPLILILSVLFLALFTYRLTYCVKKNLEDVGVSLVKNLSYASEMGVLTEDRIILESTLRAPFKRKDVLSIAIYNRRGEVLISKQKVEIDEKIPLEVIEKLRKTRGVFKRENSTEKIGAFYDFFFPILPTGSLGLISPGGAAIIGFARISLSLEAIRTEVKTIIVLGVLMVFFALLLGVAISTILAKRMAEPLHFLSKGAEIIGKGNLDYRVEIKTGDEFETLGKSFNQMAISLQRSTRALEQQRASLEIRVKARTEELRELAASLEEKVKERTKELQKRIEELEKFHRLTVGRELKMIELKKEIEKLKKELGKHKKESEN